jgi:hypothetical protein
MSEQTATADPQQSTSIFDEPEVEEAESIAGEEPGTSAIEEAESTEGEPAEVVQTDEEDADYLPSEQSKVFPVEELARYGKRYGYTKEEIDADPRLQQALKDKINSDILIKQQKELEAQEEEPTLEEEPVEEPQLDPKELRTQWFKAVDQFVDDTTDPDIANEFAAQLSAVADPKTGKLDPMKVTRTFSRFGINLLNTAAPAILRNHLQNVLREMYPEIDAIMEYQADQMNRPMYQEQWSRVKSSNKEFAELPEYGKPEFRPWAEATAAKIPNFDRMRFVDEKGKPLSKEQTAYAKYNLLAQVGMGQRVTPAIVKQAAETGKRQAAESQRKKLAGNLGAGQSKGQIAARKTGNSDIFGDVGEVAISSRL